MFDSKSLRTDSVIGEFKVGFLASFSFYCIHYNRLSVSAAMNAHCFLLSFAMTSVHLLYLWSVGHTDLFSCAQLIIVTALSCVVFSLSWMLAWCITNTVSTLVTLGCMLVLQGAHSKISHFIPIQNLFGFNSAEVSMSY